MDILPKARPARGLQWITKDAPPPLRPPPPHLPPSRPKTKQKTFVGSASDWVLCTLHRSSRVPARPKIVELSGYNNLTSPRSSQRLLGTERFTVNCHHWLARHLARTTDYRDEGRLGKGCRHGGLRLWFAVWFWLPNCYLPGSFIFIFPQSSSNIIHVTAKSDLHFYAWCAKFAFALSASAFNMKNQSHNLPWPNFSPFCENMYLSHLSSVFSGMQYACSLLRRFRPSIRSAY